MVMDVGQLRASATLDISDAMDNAKTLSSTIDGLDSKLQSFHKTHASSGGSGGGEGGGHVPGPQPPDAEGWKTSMDSISSSIRYGSTLAAQFGAQGSEITQVLRAMAAGGDLAAAGIGAVGIAAALGIATIVKLGSEIGFTDAQFTAFTGKGASGVVDQLQSVAKYGVGAEEALKALGKVAPEIQLAPGGKGFLEGKDTQYGTMQDLVKSSAQTALTLGEPFQGVEQNVADLAIAYKESFSTIDSVLEQTSIATGESTDVITSSMERIKRVLGPAAPSAEVVGNLFVAAKQAGLPEGKQTGTAIAQLTEGLNAPGAMDVLAQMGISTFQAGVPNKDVTSQFAKAWQSGKLPPGMSQLDIAKMINPSDPWSVIAIAEQPQAGTPQTTTGSPDRGDILASTGWGVLGEAKTGLGNAIGKGLSTASNDIMTGITGKSFDPRIQEMLQSPNISDDDRKKLLDIQSRGYAGWQGLAVGAQNAVNGELSSHGLPTIPAMIGPEKETNDLWNKNAGTLGYKPGAAGSIEDHLNRNEPNGPPPPTTGTGPGGVQTPFEAKMQSLNTPMQQQPFLASGMSTLIQAQTAGLTSSNELADAENRLGQAMLNADQAGATEAQSQMDVAQAKLANRDAAVSLATQEAQAGAGVFQTGTSQLQSQNQFATYSPQMQGMLSTPEQGLEEANRRLATAQQGMASSGTDINAFKGFQADASQATADLTQFKAQLDETKEAAMGVSEALTQAFSAPSKEEASANVTQAAAALEKAQIMAPHEANGTPLTSDEKQRVAALDVTSYQAGKSAQVPAAASALERAQAININPNLMSTPDRLDLANRGIAGTLPSQTSPVISGAGAPSGAIQAAFTGTIQVNFDMPDSYISMAKDVGGSGISWSWNRPSQGTPQGP